MKRYFSYAIPIAFVIYVLILLLFHLLFDGYSMFINKIYQNLFISILSGIINVALFFGFIWFNLKNTLGYLESDSFDEPKYGHKLVEEIETKCNDFNQLKEIFINHFPSVKVSEDKSAIKFLGPITMKRWNAGGISYFNPDNKKVKVILIPYMGYSQRSEKQLKDEMDKIKNLISG